MKPRLALGGGGMKCYVECAILAEIERRSGKRITDLFSLIAGTSGGAIIGLSICAGNSAADTLGFFTQDGPNIFDTHWWTGPAELIRGYKYNPAPLEAALQKRLGSKAMIDALCPIIVTSVDRNSKAAMFFKSYDPTTQNYAMWKAARASSAAQTYFPPFALNSWSLWDGGNAANNPAMCAFADGINQIRNNLNFKVLSLGCGDAAWTTMTKNPGIVSIISESLELLLECNDELPDYQLREILGSDYVSIQPMGITTGLADASPAALAQLNQIALKTIQINSDVIDQFCGG